MVDLGPWLGPDMKVRLPSSSQSADYCINWRLGEDFKDKTGMREFYTTAGHILRETVYVYGITQSHTRTLLALRELYPGYPWPPVTGYLTPGVSDFPSLPAWSCPRGRKG